MNCHGFSSELYDLYSLGVLEPDAASELRDHLERDCGTCKDQLRVALEGVSRLAMVIPLAEPRGSLRRKIVASVSPETRGFSWFGTSWVGWSSALALVVLALAAGWVLRAPSSTGSVPVIVSRIGPPPPPVVLPSRAEPEPPSRAVSPHADKNVVNTSGDLTRERAQVASLAAQLQTKDVQLASLQHELESEKARYQAAAHELPRTAPPAAPVADEKERIEALNRQVRFYQAAIEAQRHQLSTDQEIVSLLGASSLKVLTLQATEQGGNATARALVAENRRVVFYASNLPSLPAGRTYQLWLMRSHGDPVVSGGIFLPDTNHAATLVVQNATLAANINALSVTEEPAGGRLLPSGHKILFGLAKS